MYLMWTQNSVPKMTNRLGSPGSVYNRGVRILFAAMTLRKKLTLSTSKMTLQNGLLLIQGQASRATKYY